MKNYQLGGRAISINIDEISEFYIEETKNFINEIDKLFSSFSKEKADALKKFEELNKSIDSKTRGKFKYKPEALSKMSPMTVFDAKWGSGKTYFIEKTIENLMNKKIKSKKFENVIYIDAWNMSSNEKIYDSLLEEIILHTRKKVKNIKNIIFFKNRKIRVKIRRWLRGRWKRGIEINWIFSIKKRRELEAQEVINSINKFMDPTLIFIDNIERTGQEAWEIVKSISRLLQLEKLFIILPTNIQKLKVAYGYSASFDEEDEKKEKEGENPIDKYLEVDRFEFKQTFTPLLIKLGFEEKISLYLNDVLRTSNNGNSISLREVEKRIGKNGNNLARKEIAGDESELVYLFQILIWSSDQIFEKQALTYVEEIKVKIKNLKENMNGISGTNINLYNVDNRIINHQDRDDTLIKALQQSVQSLKGKNLKINNSNIKFSDSYSIYNELLSSIEQIENIFAEIKESYNKKIEENNNEIKKSKSDSEQINKEQSKITDDLSKLTSIQKLLNNETSFGRNDNLSFDELSENLIMNINDYIREENFMSSELNTKIPLSDFRSKINTIISDANAEQAKKRRHLSANELELRRFNSNVINITNILSTVDSEIKKVNEISTKVKNFSISDINIDDLNFLQKKYWEANMSSSILNSNDDTLKENYLNLLRSEYTKPKQST